MNCHSQVKKRRSFMPPAHTDEMLNYHFASLGICFVGDVLFPLGCGRIKEGTAADMWSGLQKLMKLPEGTLLYSCHDYALRNAQFALSVEPGNIAIKTHYQQLKNLSESGEPTVPSLLATELGANPFLRSHDPPLRAALNLGPDVDDVEVFAKLRAMKDRF